MGEAHDPLAVDPYMGMLPIWELHWRVLKEAAQDAVAKKAKADPSVYTMLGLLTIQRATELVKAEGERACAHGARLVLVSNADEKVPMGVRYYVHGWLVRGMPKMKSGFVWMKQTGFLYPAPEPGKDA